MVKDGDWVVNEAIWLSVVIHGLRIAGCHGELWLSAEGRDDMVGEMVRCSCLKKRGWLD
jgi:hypothetical protein